MKKIIYILIVSTSIVFSGCEKHLNTVPTTEVGSDQIFASAETALAAINGVYRTMYMSEWGPGWQHENGGYHAYLLASNLMSDDMIQNAMGSGWFWYDYVYGTAGDFTNSSGRQSQVWNFFYKLIANVNYIISHDGTLEGDVQMANYVLGQAYAIRAFAYLELVQRFQQCDPALPGVPIYTEPTTIDSEGAPRGTVQNVYDRVNEDINTAIEKLSAAEAQLHKSHIDKYVAYGIKARAQMVQKNYAGANAAAKEALNAPGRQVLPFNQTTKVNDVAKANVMWGLAIQTDQVPTNAGIYYHIDADSGAQYSKGAQFLISSWLYDNLPATDERKAWWTAPLPVGEWIDGTSKKSYCQVKLVFKDPSTGVGDYIIMRSEEMALIVAESACHLGLYPEAKEYLKKVATLRDSNYEQRLAAFADSKEITTPLNTTITTLMDEVLYQRRIELWGETSRMLDIQRLGLDVRRVYQNSNHVDSRDFPAKDKLFIYPIPMKEFNGNANLDSIEDQNPL